MTRRERLEMVIRGEITSELIEECKEELKKLDVQSMTPIEALNVLYSLKQKAEERK